MDAVHGLYDLLMHAVFGVFGDSLVALRDTEVRGARVTLHARPGCAARRST